jgi:hypothetical protein
MRPVGGLSLPNVNLGVMMVMISVKINHETHEPHENIFGPQVRVFRAFRG